ncbi:MAG: hypothetical protein J7K98_03785 [Candidatus Aenigmarchaeota archaeon]|nr:hypothetical protein [Candidatus Aenigmarchaeota archaeon]
MVFDITLILAMLLAIFGFGIGMKLGSRTARQSYWSERALGGSLEIDRRIKEVSQYIQDARRLEEEAERYGEWYNQQNRLRRAWERFKGKGPGYVERTLELARDYIQRAKQVLEGLPEKVKEYELVTKELKETLQRERERLKRQIPEEKARIYRKYGIRAGVGGVGPNYGVVIDLTYSPRLPREERKEMEKEIKIIQPLREEGEAIEEDLKTLRREVPNYINTVRKKIEELQKGLEELDRAISVLYLKNKQK